MVCPNDVALRQQLEVTFQNSPSRSFSRQVWALVQPLGLALVEALTRDRNAPRISQRRDRQGQLVWQVYDPASQQRFTTASEQAVREWLERRHLS